MQTFQSRNQWSIREISNRMATQALASVFAVMACGVAQAEPVLYQFDAHVTVNNFPTDPPGGGFVVGDVLFSMQAPDFLRGATTYNSLNGLTCSSPESIYCGNVTLAVHATNSIGTFDSVTLDLIRSDFGFQTHTFSFVPGDFDTGGSYTNSPNWNTQVPQYGSTASLTVTPSPQVTSVPEPATASLVAAGPLALCVARKVRAT